MRGACRILALGLRVCRRLRHRDFISPPTVSNKEYAHFHQSLIGMPSEHRSCLWHVSSGLALMLSYRHNFSRHSVPSEVLVYAYCHLVDPLRKLDLHRPRRELLDAPNFQRCQWKCC